MRKSVSPTYLVLRLSSPSWRWTLINDDLFPPTYSYCLASPPSPNAQLLANACGAFMLDSLCACILGSWIDFGILDRDQDLGLGKELGDLLTLIVI